MSDLLPCPFCDEGPSFTDVELKDERRYAEKLLRCCSVEMSATLSFSQYKGLTDAQIDHTLRSELTKTWNTRAALPQSRPVSGEPVAWCGWHPEHGFNLHTAADNQQQSASLLMRTGIAGNHGWSVQPLYTAPPAAAGREEIAILIMNVRRRIHGLDDLDLPTLRRIKRDAGINEAFAIADAILARDPKLTPQEQKSDEWKEDPSSDERWNAGLDFAMQQLCKALDVDPDAVTWDAATETVDGDVQAVMWNILRARFGEDWDPPAPTVSRAERGVEQ